MEIQDSTVKYRELLTRILTPPPFPLEINILKYALKTGLCFEKTKHRNKGLVVLTSSEHVFKILTPPFSARAMSKVRGT